MYVVRLYWTSRIPPCFRLLAACLLSTWSPDQCDWEIQPAGCRILKVCWSIDQQLDFLKTRIFQISDPAEKILPSMIWTCSWIEDSTLFSAAGCMFAQHMKSGSVWLRNSACWLQNSESLPTEGSQPTESILSLLKVTPFSAYWK